MNKVAIEENAWLTEAKSVGEATQQNIAQTIKTFRRNEVDDFVKSDQTDAELMQQFGKDRAGLKKWLVEIGRAHV